MKVWQRILVKFIIFILVVAAAAGGAAAYRAYRQSTAQYAIERYLTLLTNDDSAKAFALLDQSEDAAITEAEYASLTEERGYSIYASYKISEFEHRRDNDGREYVDFQAEFMNADNELVAAEDFTAKLQSDLVFGIFDQWKILSSHCMVKDFQLTVPTGSEVYLNGELLDASLINRESAAASLDCYQISGIRQGKASLVIRHAALESVNTTIEVQDGALDYSDQMALKQLAKDECLELGVSALKQLYASSVTGKKDELEELFADCLKSAKKFVKSQGAQFNADGIVFKTAAISGFSTQFDDVVFSEEENGAITTQMTLTYHYVVSQSVTGETSSEEENETSEETAASDSRSGDNEAVFTLAYYDNAWHITAIDIPKI